MKNLDIRQADIGDAGYIALLGRVTFTETFGHFFRNPQDLRDYYDRTFSVEKIQSSLKDPNNIFWLAFADDLPVGYAKLKLNSPAPFGGGEGDAQLQKIYVLKDFLGQKIGPGMQNKLLAKAAESGAETVWLSALKSNERANNFYEKAGFVRIGQHDFQIGKEIFEYYVFAKKLS